MHEADIGYHQAGTVLDLSQYFESRPVSLSEAVWCSRKSGGDKATAADLITPCSMEAMATNNLLLRFQSGPLVNVQISGGTLGSTPGALGPVEITSAYLKNNQYNQVTLGYV